MLANVGSIPARSKTNIAGVALGRLEAGEHALAIESVDSDLHEHVLKEIAGPDGVFDAKVVGL